MFRASAALPALKSAAFLIAGGYDGNRALDEVEAYNPATDSWQMLTPLPAKCHGLAMGVAGGELFAAGGWDSFSRDRLDACHVIRPITTRLACPPSAWRPQRQRLRSNPIALGC